MDHNPCLLLERREYVGKSPCQVCKAGLCLMWNGGAALTQTTGTGGYVIYSFPGKSTLNL